jgi:uncharacterized protein YqeY
MLKNNITDLIKVAMRDKDAETLSILRVLKGEIERNEQTSKGKVELSDADIVAIAKKLLQSSKDTGASATEISVLESFVPKQMTESELTELTNDYIRSNNLSLKDMGVIMNHFKNTYSGQYDGKVLSGIVKTILT